MRKPKDPSQWARLFDVVTNDFSQPAERGAHLPPGMTCVAGSATAQGLAHVLYPEPEPPRFDAGAFQIGYYRQFGQWPSIAQQDAERKRVEREG
jgi:hypothetical protein